MLSLKLRVVLALQALEVAWCHVTTSVSQLKDRLLANYPKALDDSAMYINGCQHNETGEGNMIRCCLCAHWFHMDCVDLTQDESVDLWSYMQVSNSNSNSNSKYIYSTHFKYSIIFNLIYSKNNRVRRHTLRHLVLLSYMPPFVFIYYTISILC